jgi:ribonuclease H / adenosylcobalamin/alpha-ribazole phosphatase
VRARTTWISARGEPTATLLLRHGQTPMSVQKRYAGLSPKTDAPLTETGVRQAVAAAKRLASAGIDAIVASPLQRTVRTAEEVAAVTGVPVLTDEGFRETDFGAWEGLTFAEVRERWPSELTTWLADPSVAPPGGESFDQVSERVTAALHRILAERAHQTVLIVSHVTPIKTLVADALGAPLEAVFRMELSPASVTVISYFSGGPGGDQPMASLRLFNARPGPMTGAVKIG